jgi:hypothetical protein
VYARIPATPLYAAYAGEPDYSKCKCPKWLYVYNAQTGAKVVGQVREEGVAEGVVAEVLDSATAIGVGVGLVKPAFLRLRVAQIHASASLVLS